MANYTTQVLLRPDCSDLTGSFRCDAGLVWRTAVRRRNERQEEEEREEQEEEQEAEEEQEEEEE